MTDVLIQARPPSPAPSVPDQLDYDIRHLVRHGRAVSAYDEYTRSQLDPRAVEAMQDMHAARYGHGYPNEVGLGIDVVSASAYVRRRKLIRFRTE